MKLKMSCVLTDEYLLELEKYITQCDMEKIMAHLGKISIADAFDFRGSNLLHCVCWYSRDENVLSKVNGELIKHLIRSGCDVNATNSSGDVPMVYAVHTNNVEAVELMLDAGAIHSLANFRNTTPLHVAARHSFPEMVKMLLRKGLKVDTCDSIGETALLCSTRNINGKGNYEILKILIDAGASVNTRNNFDYTPLHKGIIDYRTAKLLISEGAEINVESKSGDTPLHAACSQGSYETIEMLLDKGADILAPGCGGNGPLHRAAYANRDKGVFELLLSRGASVHCLNRNGHDAICRGMIGLRMYQGSMFSDVRSDRIGHLNGDIPEESNAVTWIRLLIEHGAKLNRDDRAKSPLYVTLEEFPNRQIVRLLLSHGAIFDMKDDLIKRVFESKETENARDVLIARGAIFHGLEGHERPDAPLNFDVDRLANDQDQWERYEACALELLDMRSQRIPRTDDISYLDVLVDADAVGRYARNANVVEALEERTIARLFPIYAFDLGERRRVFERCRALVPGARKALGRVFGKCPIAFAVVFDGVIDHLGETDLKSLSQVN